MFVCLWIVIALLYNFLSPNGIALITPKRTVFIGEKQYAIPVFQPGNQTISETDRFLSDIDFQKALQLFHAPEPIFLDARSPEEYAGGHIPGAINIPVNDLESFDLDMMTVPSNQVFVSYCSDPACDLALQLTFWLEEQGFKNLYYYSAGWQEWIEKGGQISTGERP